MSDPMKTAVNTLRLNQRDLRKLLEALEQHDAENGAPEREFVRNAYQVESVQLTLEHQGGSRATIPVATRNISRGGISILHSSFIHTGTPCDIALKMPGSKLQHIPGVVKRCLHITGRVHEIGIKFNDHVSTKELLGLDPLSESYSLERVDPERLHGSVLIATASDIDRNLMIMILEQTNLAINTADNIENAVARAQKGADLVLADLQLEDETAAELIGALTEAGCDMPVLVLTSDKSESTLDTIRDSNASGILSKPIDQDRMLQAIAEFLHADGDGGPLYSTLNANDAAYPLLGKFMTEITRMILNLEKALREDDEQGCAKIIRALSGSAAPLGFPHISQISIAAEGTISSMGLKAAQNEIRSLIVACRRIKSRPAA